MTSCGQLLWNSRMPCILPETHGGDKHVDGMGGGSNIGINTHGTATDLRTGTTVMKTKKEYTGRQGKHARRYQVRVYNHMNPSREKWIFCHRYEWSAQINGWFFGRILRMAKVNVMDMDWEQYR